MDAAEFAKTRLGFDADAPQREMLLSKTKRAILELHAAVGEVFTGGSEGSVPRVHGGEVHGDRGESRGAAERRVPTQGRRDDRTPGYPAARGWLQQNVGVAAERVANRGVSPAVKAKIRGFSALSMLVIDEAARVEDGLYHALRPMLAVGNGDLWLMSTPCGKRGFFYETWEHAGPEWLRVKVPATECPRISKEFLEEQRSAMGLESFRQEHMCEFVGSGMGVFDRDLVEAALDDSFEELVV